MTQPGGIAVQRFVDTFRPDPDVTVPAAPFLEYAEQHAPDTLGQLWRTHGLGFYGEQRVALVDPSDWQEALQVWCGPQTTSYPFAVSSFGHLYHYDQIMGRDRIQCLDPHFRSNTVVPGDLVSFFVDHLPGPSSHLRDLEGPRAGARGALGELSPGEIYYFAQPIGLGGQVRPDNLAKGNGPTHLRQLHEQLRGQHA